jgi:hypothetical protein
MENANTKRLENTIDHLTEEYQLVLLSVLEAFTFAQNASEMPVKKLKRHNKSRSRRRARPVLVT